MSLADRPPDTLVGGGSDGPRGTRPGAWVARVVIGALAVLVLLTVFVTNQDGEDTSGETNSIATQRALPLPAAPVGAFFVLEHRGRHSGRVSFPSDPVVVEIECTGPGSVFVRLNARSSVSQGCTPGLVRRAERVVTLDELEQLDPGPPRNVFVSVSTVSTTPTSRWRVSLHPPVDGPS